MNITNDILAVLSNAEISGNIVKLMCGQLERKMYLEVNDVLENIGGKWDRKAKGHVFDEDPTDRLETVFLTGEIVPPKKYGYFPTPPVLAMRVVELARLEKGMTVLEPSAGQGALALEAARIVGKENIDCVELLEANVKVLREKGFKAQQCDFPTIKPKPYDRVIMNPPFERQQDIDHVLHAYRCLKKGGILVSIMSSGVTFRENKKTVEFRKLLDWFEPNPEGSFKASGINVNTVTVVLGNAQNA